MPTTNGKRLISKSFLTSFKTSQDAANDDKFAAKEGEADIAKIHNVTAGSSSQPAYFDNGTPTACGNSLSVDITGNAATASSVEWANVANKPTDLPTHKRYGFIIDQDNDDPDDCVSYIYDAVGMTPAGLDENNTFQYGSWEAFCKDINYPVMIDADGSVLYELDRNDQSKTVDGGTCPGYNDSTVNAGNMMAAFRKLYCSITQTDNKIKVVFCDAKLDETYQAEAFVDEKGDERNVAYHSMFQGSLDANNKIRSLAYSGKSVHTTDSVVMNGYCKANGPGWDFPSFSLRQHITLLLTLISKSLDCKLKFGKGNINSSESSYKAPGTYINKGQFFGTKANESTGVKVFYIEHFWGESWIWHQGLLEYGGYFYTRSRPPYTYDSLVNYTKRKGRPGTRGWLVSQKVDGPFILPNSISSDSSNVNKYYKSYEYSDYNDNIIRPARFGGARNTGSDCSCWCLNVNTASSYSFWAVSARLVFI